MLAEQPLVGKLDRVRAGEARGAESVLGLAVEEIGASLGADSLGYISEEGMVAATEQPRSQLCTACFSGVYPIELPPADRLGKHLLEQNELPLGAPEDGLMSILPGTGGATALEHP